MGYHAHSTDSDFFMEKKNITLAGDAVYNKLPGIADSSDLVDMFTYLGFSAEIDDSGNIFGLYFCDENYHSDDVKDAFDVIAPYVTAGSYIGFCGEDDSLWAYYFNGYECVEYSGSIVYPGMPTNGPIIPSGVKVSDGLAEE